MDSWTRGEVSRHNHTPISLYPAASTTRYRLIQPNADRRSSLEDICQPCAVRWLAKEDFLYEFGAVWLKTGPIAVSARQILQLRLTSQQTVSVQRQQLFTSLLSHIVSD